MSIELKDITFLDGSNAGGNGGNVFIRGFGSPHRIVKCNFQNGRSEQGGNVYIKTTGSIKIRVSNFIDGTAASVGGGLVVNGATELTVQESLFAGNTAESEGGGMFSTRLDPNDKKVKKQLYVTLFSKPTLPSTVEGPLYLVWDLYQAYLFVLPNS